MLSSRFAYIHTRQIGLCAEVIGRGISSTAATTADAPSANSSAKPSVPASIRKIGIIGAGQMGIGIAQVAAQVAKVSVLVLDTSKERLHKQVAFVESLLSKNVSKGKMTEEEKSQVMNRFSTTTDLKDFEKVDYVIEAVNEDVNLKLDLFKKLSEITRKETILASNTSSISITKIASVSSKPEKVIGVHFMNPVPVMQLVEVIPGLATSADTLSNSLQLVGAMGKLTAQSQDVPGFIANRLLMPYINEAIFALHENLGTREDIDKTMKYGTNMPMGPLTLADFIGLDTCLAIMRILHTQLGDSKYRPCPLLIRYVDAGWLGKKSGRGFYDYSV